MHPHSDGAGGTAFVGATAPDLRARRLRCYPSTRHLPSPRSALLFPKTTPMRPTVPFALAAALAATLPAPAPAQVVISEIAFASPSPWIELVNLGSATAQLTGWSLYQSTKTAGMPQNYWFPFPTGTAIGPAQLLRVHWLRPIEPSNTNPQELYTGTSVHNFLFGYPPEAVSPNEGALAVFNTQNSNNMNNPASVVDWVSWGSSGFKREDFAVQRGLWETGAFVPFGLAQHSLALIYDNHTEPTKPDRFFHDESPTPLTPNHTQAFSETYGTSCSIGAGNVPQMEVISLPVVGNRDWALRVHGFGPTPPVDQVLFIIGFPDKQGLQWPGLPRCSLWLNASLPLLRWSQQAIVNGEARLGYPLPFEASLASFAVQALAFPQQNLSGSDLALTSACSMTVGL